MPLATREPAGYLWLIQQFRLQVRDPVHCSFIGTTSSRETGRASVTDVYRPEYRRAPAVGPQLEFALRYDGVDLEVLSATFRTLLRERRTEELQRWILETPTGAWVRRVWLLYEWLTEQRLDVPDLKSGNYVDLLDKEKYFTTLPRPSRRHRVNVNLLGPRSFCPVVRRVPALESSATLALLREAHAFEESADSETLRRAIGYLYTKETMTSFGIEGEKPGPLRTERFVRALQGVAVLERLDKAALVQLQNETVGAEAVEADYRTEQVYVGRNVDFGRPQRIDYVAPVATDVPDLMHGWFVCLEQMFEAQLDPIVLATVASFGFVFIHPFTDGNGRLHRLLIHYILSRTGFTPKDMILPVSAVMLQERRAYDDALATYSNPVMQLVDYDEDPEGRVTVKGEIRDLYRFFDATGLAEYLRRVLERTIRVELRQEVDFLVRQRAARDALDALVDLPDREANLFIRFLHQNGWKLAKAKRGKFPRLSDEQIQTLEEAVRDAFENPGQAAGENV
jgi:hypothetical protein